MLRRYVFRAVAALVASGNRLFGADHGYLAGIAEWRNNYDSDLRSEKGPLYLIARHSVPEGSSEIGSDPSSRIELPDRAPKRVGAIERRGDMVTFKPTGGIAVKLNGKPISGPATLGTVKPIDKLEFGDYFVSALRLLRPGGIMLFNAVLPGSTAAERTPTDAEAAAAAELRDQVRADDRLIPLLL